MSDAVAWWNGEPVSEAVLLARVGPGLAPGPAAPPLSALAWNGFAFELGRRLLVELAKQPGAAAHVLDAASSGLAAVAGTETLLRDPKDGALAVAMIEATLRPMATLDGSSAAALLLRIFLWGTRRLRRDRHHPDSLAALAGAACEVHAELAALSGHGDDAAREAERTAQLADARGILAAGES